MSTIGTYTKTGIGMYREKEKIPTKKIGGGGK